MRTAAKILGIATLCSLSLPLSSRAQSLQQQYYQEIRSHEQDQASCFATRNKLAKNAYYPMLGWAPLGSIFYIDQGRVKLLMLYQQPNFCKVVDNGPYGTVEVGSEGFEKRNYQWIIESGKLCKYREHQFGGMSIEKTCLHRIGNKNPDALPPSQ